jgi:hypothetical protein
MPRHHCDHNELQRIRKQPHSRDGRLLSLRGNLRGKMALDDADLGLSPLACASVCAGQLLRCIISPALHKGTWLSGPRAYLLCGLLSGSSHRSDTPDAHEQTGVTDARFSNPFDDVRHFPAPFSPKPTRSVWLENRLGRPASRARHWTSLLANNPVLPGLLYIIITRSIEDRTICGPGCRGFESPRSPHGVTDRTAGFIPTELCR